MHGLALALVVLGVVITLALLARRRPASHDELASRVEPLPAGVKHLASNVSTLSDFELHLPAVRRALSPRRRLGTLLQPR